MLSDQLSSAPGSVLNPPHPALFPPQSRGRGNLRCHCATSFFVSRYSLILLMMALSIGCSRSDRRPIGAESFAPSEADVLRPPSGGEMVRVPAGHFRMGDPDGLADETPHEVSISAFYIDRRPITQKLYESVMGVNPSRVKAPNNPVERIRWTDAAMFCNRCSKLEGLTPCYDEETWACDFSADGYRLPTEAEWEYACRAGSDTRYCFGDDERLLAQYAWCKPHSRGRPHEVGQKRPNAWGLYDMHGNVWEWCNDFYSADYYEASPPADPRGPESGKQRVLRGGAWSSSAAMCRSAQRFQELPVFTDACFGADSYGFRRVRSVPNNRTKDRSSHVTRRLSEPPAGEQSNTNRDKAHTASSKHAITEIPESRAAMEPVVSSEKENHDIKESTHPARAEGPLDPTRLKGTIVFVSDRSGNLDIWTMRPDGTDCRPLTQDEEPDADPRFSPDGRRIMYTSLTEGFPEIWIMNRDGSNPARVTEGSQGDWAPDGNSIVFIRDDQVYVRNLNSGKERLVSPESWKRCGVPAWSPDGRRIAVASRHTGTIGVFLLTLDGNPTPLATEDPCCTPRWSADGKRILFQTVKGHIHELDIQGGSEEPLTFGADIQHDACYSPDGSMVVFARGPSQEGPWQLCVVDLKSEDLDVVPITGEGSNRQPDWHWTEEN